MVAAKSQRRRGSAAGAPARGVPGAREDWQMECARVQGRSSLDSVAAPVAVPQGNFGFA
jgi:hypothetical protein